MANVFRTMTLWDRIGRCLLLQERMQFLNPVMQASREACTDWDTVGRNAMPKILRLTSDLS